FESTKPSAARTGNSSEPTAAKKVPIAGPEIGTATAHSKPCPCRPTGRLIKLSGRAEICLESAHLEVSPEIGLNALRRGAGSMKSGVVRNFMQEGGLPSRATIGQRLGALGRVEHDLNLAVLDGVHDVGPAFQHLVDLGGLDALLG